MFFFNINFAQSCIKISDPGKSEMRIIENPITQNNNFLFDYKTFNIVVSSSKPAEVV